MADFETDDLWALVAGTFFLGIGLVIIVPIICLILWMIPAAIFGEGVAVTLGILFLIIGALSILLGLFLMIASVVLLFTQNPAAVAVISTWVELGILSFLASKINSGSKK